MVQRTICIMASTYANLLSASSDGDDSKPYTGYFDMKSRATATSSLRAPRRAVSKKMGWDNPGMKMGTSMRLRGVLEHCSERTDITMAETHPSGSVPLT